MSRAQTLEEVAELEGIDLNSLSEEEMEELRSVVEDEDFNPLGLPDIKLSKEEMIETDALGLAIALLSSGPIVGHKVDDTEESK